jgi:outer membrane protein insertion porin family
MKNASDIVKYKYIEFHKWTFKADYYYPILPNSDKLVLNTRFNFGYIGYYNKDIGPSPFENFSVGGDGMTGYSFYGREMIKLRGYGSGSNGVGSLTIYVLGFLESGRAWYALKEFNPFKMNRAAGVGVRANLPMFGLLGVDWGYGFDPVPDPTTYPNANKGQFQFTIGQEF